MIQEQRPIAANWLIGFGLGGALVANQVMTSAPEASRKRKTACKEQVSIKFAARCRHVGDVVGEMQKVEERGKRNGKSG
jgi:gas vesicle protein